jgi:sugar phosphate isomerase/epimerase
MLSRREFIKLSTAGAIVGLSGVGMASTLLGATNHLSKPLQLLVFSKHLQFLNYTELCEAVKEMGFDGIDLTVRPNGHVLPENVAVDLPKVSKAMKAVGFSPTMLTTAIIDGNNAINKNIIETASKQGYNYYRMGWFKYSKNPAVENELNSFTKEINTLSVLNKQNGITGTYQNHSGKYMGSALWDLNQSLKGITPKVLGSQYDITHAMIDGGLNWEIGFHLIKKHINSLVFKDFRWEKVDGDWKPRYVPIGEGMVDFKRFFSLLKTYKINVPVSMHFEYPLGGAEKGNKAITIDKSVVYNALKKDLSRIRQLWEDAKPE